MFHNSVYFADATPSPLCWALLRDARLLFVQIIDAFDATRHPEVVSRRRAPDAIFRDFVDGFSAGFPEDREASAYMVGRLEMVHTSVRSSRPTS